MNRTLSATAMIHRCSNFSRTLMKTCLNRLNVSIHRRRAVAALGLCLSLLFLVGAPRAGAATASPGDYMTYQGFLVDSTGTPLATNNPANYPVIFRIYSVATAGTALWTEQQVVTVDKGQFSVVLGEGSAFGSEARPPLSSVFTNATASDRYIGISVTVGSVTTDILPRLRLVPSPYSFLSAGANKLIGTNGFTYLGYNTPIGRAEIAANLFVAGVISGDGSGLTGLSASQIPALNASTITAGTLADARLSGNVALRAGGNSFTGNQIISSGNLGLSVATPAFPLSLASSLGDKISLYGLSGVSYGFGVQSGLLQIHSDVVGSDVAFGYGSSASFTEVMRVKGSGNVGIGTNSPQGALHVRSPNTYLAEILDSGNAAGTWISLRNTSTGGHNWNLVSSGSGNGEGAGKLLINDQTGGGTVVQVETAPANKVTVNGNLDVTGALTSGTSKYVTGPENLKIVRGRVSSQGLALGTASGWSVAPGAGVYQLKFTDGGFSEVPAITVTLVGNVAGSATISSITTAGFTVTTFQDLGSTSLLLPREFHFIAIGPR